MPAEPPAPAGEGAAPAPPKRARESPGPEPAAKRAKAPAAAPKKRKEQTGEQHLRVKRKAIPDGARTLVAALYVHLGILGGTIAPASVPRLPTPADVIRFDGRYTSMDEVLALRNNPNIRTSANNDMIQRLVELRADHNGSSTRAKQAGRVPESALQFVLGQLAKYGLRSWRPNYNEDPYSLYNSVHRLVAIDTFRQLVVSLAYDHMAVDKSFLDQMLLLTQVYDHYVHYRLFKIWEREQKYPGAARAEMERDTILARRRKVAEDRGAFIGERGYPKWVVELVSNPEATSDDEEGFAKINGSVVAVYWIREREERSKIFTSFVRWIDERRKLLKQKRTRRGPVNTVQRATGAAERIRIVCPRPKVSEEPLPTGIALDWYDVDAFNKLDYSFRALFSDEPTIAMPDDIDLLTAAPDDPRKEATAWRMLTQRQWMEQFGEARLEKYRIPAGQGIQAGSAADGGGGAGQERLDEIAVDNDMVSEQERFAAAAKRGLGPTQPDAPIAPVPPRTGVPGRPIAGKGKGVAVPRDRNAPAGAIPIRRAAAPSSSVDRFSAGSGPPSGSGSAGAAAGGGTPAGNAAQPGPSGKVTGPGGKTFEVFTLDADVEMVEESL